MPTLGETITLDGSGSYDPESQPLYYSWREYPGNPKFGLIPPFSETNPQPEVFIEWPGRYIFMLVVNDGVYNSVEAVVTVNAPGVAGTVSVSRTNGIVPVDVAQVSAQSRTANTRSDGIFNLVGTTSGMMTLQVHKTGYTDWQEDINVPTYGKRMDNIELAPSMWLFTGKVTDYADNPIEGVTVWVVPGSGIADTTDSNGLFSVQQVPTGTWDVTFCKYGYGIETHPIYFSQNMYREETLDQAPITTLTGHVYYTDTQLPLSGVTVTADNNYIATTNSAGYYQLPGIASGQYMLVASKSGLDFYRNTITVPPAGLQWDIDMTGGTYGVYGEVKNAAGNPIDGATIDFQGGVGRKMLVAETSDATGYYAQDVPYGQRTLVFSAPGYPTKTITMDFSGHTRLNVTLSSEVNLVSVTASPASLQIRPGRGKYLRAIAYYDNGATQEVSSQATWQSANQSIATVSNGWVVGQAEGSTTVKATYNGMESALVNVEVTSSAPAERLVLGSGSYSASGKDEIATFRASNGLWAIRNGGRFYLGDKGDIPASGDYNGDGLTDITIYRPSSGMWSIRNVSRFYFGSNTDIPVPGDYNGDGRTDTALFRETTSMWSVRNLTRLYFGASGDLPVPGDYDGDGTQDAGMYRGSSGMWAVNRITRVYFGSSSDVPVAGDYDGDGRAEIGTYRPSSGMWSIQGLTRIYLGNSLDQAVPADYDGNTRDEPGLFRESSGMWTIRNLTRVYFGSERDIPVTR